MARFCKCKGLRNGSGVSALRACFQPVGRVVVCWEPAPAVYLMKIVGVFSLIREALLTTNHARSRQSRRNHRGIAFIHHELNVLDNLTCRKRFLGVSRCVGLSRLIDRKKIHADTGLSAAPGFNVPTTTLLGTLPIAQQQMVEIAKPFSYGAPLDLDERLSLTLRKRRAAKL